MKTNEQQLSQSLADFDNYLQDEPIDYNDLY